LITRPWWRRRLAGDGESAVAAEMGAARKAARSGWERKHLAVGVMAATVEEAAGGLHRAAEVRARARRGPKGMVGSSG